MNSDDATPSPELTLSENDPGDETAARFYYQWSCAAIACGSLLDGNEDVIEVFCEHHEDVLLKHADGSFTGQQVKTRESSQPVWKTSDEAVLASCIRFVNLEAAFGSKFRRYLFATNHPLYRSKNGQDVVHVLNLMKSTPDASSVPPVARTLLKKVARDAGSTVDVAYAALRKAIASDEFPKLPDVRARIAQTLIDVWPEAETCSTTVLLNVVDRLISECGRASALSHKGLLPAYLPVLTTAVEREMQQRIAGKRITKERLLDLLREGMHQTAALHCDAGSIVPPGIGSTDLLRTKLDVGGFSMVSTNSASDLRDKADYLGVVWTKKYGREAGLQRYSHVKSLVLVDAAAAFEEAAAPGKFGLQMLGKLRQRFALRRSDGAQLFDCSNEHLEGFAFVLTAQCQIAWSTERPWESK